MQKFYTPNILHCHPEFIFQSEMGLMMSKTQNPFRNIIENFETRIKSYTICMFSDYTLYKLSC